jgi:hypothetical protein
LQQLLVDESLVNSQPAHCFGWTKNIDRTRVRDIVLK